MCTRVRTHLNVHIPVYTYKCAHGRCLCVYVSVCRCVRTHVCVYVYECVHMHVYVYQCARIHVDEHMHVHTCACMYIYVCVHALWRV